MKVTIKIGNIKNNDSISQVNTYRCKTNCTLNRSEAKKTEELLYRTLATIFF